jgi:hypothetical protein
VPAQENKLLVTASFDDGTPARDAKVSVVNADDGPISTGRTNVEGEWTCVAPPPGTYRVLVDAGAGHRARVRLTVPEPDGKTQDSAAHTSTNAYVFTWSRWVDAGVGIVIIGILALALRAFLRYRSHSRGRDASASADGTRSGT